MRNQNRKYQLLCCVYFHPKAGKWNISMIVEEVNKE